MSTPGEGVQEFGFWGLFLFHFLLEFDLRGLYFALGAFLEFGFKGLFMVKGLFNNFCWGGGAFWFGGFFKNLSWEDISFDWENLCWGLFLVRGAFSRIWFEWAVLCLWGFFEYLGLRFFLGEGHFQEFWLRGRFKII